MVLTSAWARVVIVLLVARVTLVTASELELLMLAFTLTEPAVALALVLPGPLAPDCAGTEASEATSVCRCFLCSSFFWNASWSYTGWDSRSKLIVASSAADKELRTPFFARALLRMPSLAAAATAGAVSLAGAGAEAVAAEAVEGTSVGADTDAVTGRGTGVV